MRARSRHTWLAPVLLTAITLIAYHRAPSLPFVDYDDDAYVFANPVVSKGLSWQGVRWAFTTGHQANWHPLTWLSHMADVSLFGLDPSAHHAINVLLHTANALLLLVALRRMTGAVWRSAIVAGLFAVHPLHVESVAWVSERKDVLSTFFLFLALIAYSEYVRRSRETPGPRASMRDHEPGSRHSPGTPGVEAGRSSSAASRTVGVQAAHGDGEATGASGAKTRHHGIRDSGWYAAVVGFYALGLMTKPMVITLPFLLLLLDYWPLARLRLGRGSTRALARLILEKTPLFVLCFISAIVTYLVQRGGGAMEALENLALAARLGNALLTYVTYAGKSIWPAELAAVYPHPGASLPVWQAAASALMLILISFGVTVRLERRPYLAIGWAWYIGMLVPVIGIVQVGVTAMADRYTYVPVVGLFIAIVWAGADLIQRHAWTTTRWARGALAAAISAVFAALTWRTIEQTEIWRDSERLFAHAIQVAPDNPGAQTHLALVYLNRNRVDEAIAVLHETLQRHPELAEVHTTLGVAYRRAGDIDSAIRHHRQAIQIKPDNPTPHANLGIALFYEGRIEEAETALRRALELDADFANAHAFLGIVLADQGRRDEAERHLIRALQLQPDHPQAIAALDGLRQAQNALRSD